PRSSTRSRCSGACSSAAVADAAGGEAADTSLIGTPPAPMGDRCPTLPTVGRPGAIGAIRLGRRLMGQYDELDPGHGEPGHVHDEQWNRHMMETDDPRTDRPTDDERRQNPDRVETTPESPEPVVPKR